MGYRNVLNTIHESNEYIPVRSTYILQVHRDLLRKVGFSHGGYFKNIQNYINETKPDRTVVMRFTPIAPYDTPEAVENLCNAYEQAIASEKVDAHKGSSAYDIVKKYVEEKVAQFTSAEVVAYCLGIERSSVLASLKKLTEKGLVVGYGLGRSTYYVRGDSK